MTFYRHFVEKKDFETIVATNSPNVVKFHLPYQPIRFDLPKWWRRLSNTRHHPWITGFQSLHGEWFLPKHVMDAASQFQPDVVFTMAGSWDWTALAARKVAKKLGVPLVASFNDWYDYPWFRGHPAQRRAIENRFKRFYREADLALCTSEGMREELGPHPNAHVWYPSGAAMPDTPLKKICSYQSGAKSHTVLFGGSLGEWHGPMLEELVKVCMKQNLPIKFRFYGSLATWSPSFDRMARESGIYGGHIPFEQLANEAATADVLLLLMGFDPSAAHIQRTSFKTKFLDYLTFRRPILVWGPEYSSAIRAAREFDSAECVTEPAADRCAKALWNLIESKERKEQLTQNGEAMYHDRFHPDKIHHKIINEIYALTLRKRN